MPACIPSLATRTRASLSAWQIFYRDHDAETIESVAALIRLVSVKKPRRAPLPVPFVFIRGKKANTRCARDLFASLANVNLAKLQKMLEHEQRAGTRNTWLIYQDDSPRTSNCLQQLSVLPRETAIFG